VAAPRGENRTATFDLRFRFFSKLYIYKKRKESIFLLSIFFFPLPPLIFILSYLLFREDNRGGKREKKEDALHILFIYFSPANFTNSCITCLVLGSTSLGCNSSTIFHVISKKIKIKIKIKKIIKIDSCGAVCICEFVYDFILKTGCSNLYI
jgi:hypothetical protein